MSTGRNAKCPCGSGKKFKLCCLPKAQTTGQRVVNIKRDVKQIPGPAIMALLPTRGRVTIETVFALSRFDGIPHFKLPISRMGVTEARNSLAETALALPGVAEIDPKAGWYCLWIDDDAYWKPGTIALLLRALGANPQIDILAGWFSGRSTLSAPKATYADGTWPRPSQEGSTCEFGDIVEVDSIGFHFVLHKLDVLEKLGPKPFSPAEGPAALTEDAQFCANAKAKGLRIYTHTGAPVAHVDDEGYAYLPGEPRMKISGGNLVKLGEDRRSYGPDVDRVVAQVADQPTHPEPVGA